MRDRSPAMWLHSASASRMAPSSRAASISASPDPRTLRPRKLLPRLRSKLPVLWARALKIATALVGDPASAFVKQELQQDKGTGPAAPCLVLRKPGPPPKAARSLVGDRVRNR